MKTVFKFALDAEDYVDVAMPAGAKILHVGGQMGRIYIWALVDPNERQQLRRFRIAGTGHPISDEESTLFYLGTIHLAGDALIFHVFEVKPS